MCLIPYIYTCYIVVTESILFPTGVNKSTFNTPKKECWFLVILNLLHKEINESPSFFVISLNDQKHFKLNWNIMSKHLVLKFTVATIFATFSLTLRRNLWYQNTYVSADINVHITKQDWTLTEYMFFFIYGAIYTINQ